MKTTRFPYLSLLTCSLLVLLLTACGQRGPLYLPEEDGTAAPPKTEIADDDETEDDAAETDGGFSGK